MCVTAAKGQLIITINNDYIKKQQQHNKKEVDKETCVRFT